jgi:hypothetical protein
VKIIVESPDSGWAIATAIGTIGAAVVTAIAVGVAIVTGIKDRRMAERTAAEDRRAARANVQAQLKASRRRAELEHEVDILLKLQLQVGEYQYCHDTHDTEHRASTYLSYIRGLVYALPDQNELPGVRITYLEDGEQRSAELVAELERRHRSGIEPSEYNSVWFHQREIADLIRKRMDEGANAEASG